MRQSFQDPAYGFRRFVDTHITNRGDAFGDYRARFVENPTCDGMEDEPAASLPTCTETTPSAFASGRVQLTFAALALQNGTALRHGELRRPQVE